MTATRSLWVSRAFPLLVLVVPMLAIGAVTLSVGSVLLDSVVTVMFINLVMVLALQIFMGNSGVASFGHVVFMMIGAYGSILFTMSPEQKALAIPAMPKTWWVTNGPRAVVGISPYTTIWVAAGWGVAAIIIAWLFKESGLGLRLRASREDTIAAASIGIDTVWVRWVGWTLSGALTAIAGALWAHYVTNVSALDFWIPRAFLLITMLIVGSQTSVGGVVVGTVVITVVSESLRTVKYTANILRVTNPIVAAVIPREVVGLTAFVLASALILILILRPAGIMAGYEFDWRWIGRRPKSAGGASPAPGVGQQALES
jgi:branched-chain amino acid transport system permease protein